MLKGQKGNTNKTNIINNGKKIKVRMNLLFFLDCGPEPIILYLKHFVKDFSFWSQMISIIRRQTNDFLIFLTTVYRCFINMQVETDEYSQFINKC